MIKIDETSQDLIIVEFGHGTVKICPTNDEGTMIANGIALIHADTPQPIGTHNPQDMGKDVREVGKAVLLLFTKIASIDILIEDLQAVKKGMIEGKSVQEARDVD